ncbi:hypothetical protein QBZ16_001963 [Prototheca wickerhamii]|uniref:Uncharacterized protein n=1 Tax=Prototheca wickerhamii TaxID=3111 RepID=A0AAD9IJP9_PROWI|nr:hypothetical protein QBZ16_001963 [Prototheca wickerhamii]
MSTTTPSATSSDPEEDILEDSEELDPVRDRGVGEYGCRHYRRRAKLVTPCCDSVFWCRHCHNEARQDNEPDCKLRHELDRSTVREVECALCALRQPVAEACAGCGVAFGRYACTRCPFFDDDLRKRTFHCDDCGICRVGGRENYFHCPTCGSCYAVALRGNHRCVERSMHTNCPVCYEYLFESTEPTSVLPCGHTLHSSCLSQLQQSHGPSIVPCCPICKHSIHDYAQVWRQLDEMATQAAEMDEYRGWTADILCNDCLCVGMGFGGGNVRLRDRKQGTVPYNVVGLKCEHCGAYNTRRLAIHQPSEPDE